MSEPLAALGVLLAFAAVVFQGWCQLSRANDLQRRVSWLDLEIGRLNRQLADKNREIAELRRVGRVGSPQPRESAYSRSMETNPPIPDGSIG